MGNLTLPDSGLDGIFSGLAGKNGNASASGLLGNTYCLSAFVRGKNVSEDVFKAIIRPYAFQCKSIAVAVKIRFPAIFALDRNRPYAEQRESRKSSVL